MIPREVRADLVPQECKRESIMESSRKIVLASQSPRRRELLSGFISDFEIITDNSEEVVKPELQPEEVVKTLATQKARNVAAKADKEAIVIAADTVVFIDGKILGKPSNEVEAAEMLHNLSGREHHVCTGIAVIDNKLGKEVCDFERTTVSFKPLTDGEIERYIKTGEPMDKAGAYGIQGIGALFVQGIKGDYFNVVGLPLCKLGQLLGREFSYKLF